MFLTIRPTQVIYVLISEFKKKYESAILVIVFSFIYGKVKCYLEIHQLECYSFNDDSIGQ
jgi:hypothetical protein